jgi:hypothetical protein
MTRYALDLISGGLSKGRSVLTKGERILLAAAIASCLGAIIYWTLFDFRRAGFAAYLPFLIPPVAVVSFWVVRERRLRAQVVLWEAVMAPFPTRNFPAPTLDLESHGVGWMEVRGGVKVGAVVCQPTDAGIHLRMAYGSPRFNPKLIPWEEIARLSYLQTGTLKGFGEASLGYVAVQFATPRNLKMVIPWRETFNSLVPQRLGFEALGRVSGAA